MVYNVAQWASKTRYWRKDRGKDRSDGKTMKKT